MCLSVSRHDTSTVTVVECLQILWLPRANRNPTPPQSPSAVYEIERTKQIVNALGVSETESHICIYSCIYVQAVREPIDREAFIITLQHVIYRIYK